MYKPTPTDISVFQSLFNALKNAYTSGPMPTTISVPKPAPGPTGATGATGATGGTGASSDYDTPDANGFVAFTLPAGNSFSGLRIACQEVGLSLPTGSQGRGVCLANTNDANSKYDVMGFIGVCHQCQPVKNQTTGNTDWVMQNPQVAIDKSLALPGTKITDDGQSFDTSTVAGAKAYLLYQGAKQQRPPVTT